MAGGNGGRTGEPEEVRVHDFLDKTLGKAIPYGVYDMANNQGWVSVGIDHDTAQFAANSIRRWWTRMGSRRFPAGQRTADHRRRRRQQRTADAPVEVALQGLADDFDLTLSVCHFPPGTSKWNKIEHRLFSFITQNWRGQPLVSHQAIVNLIASTTTRGGLLVKAALDMRRYETARPPGPRRSIRALTDHATRVSRRLELHYRAAPLKPVVICLLREP